MFNFLAPLQEPDKLIIDINKVALKQDISEYKQNLTAFVEQMKKVVRNWRNLNLAIVAVVTIVATAFIFAFPIIYDLYFFSALTGLAVVAFLYAVTRDVFVFVVSKQTLLKSKIKEHESLLSQLEYAEKKSCINIQKWLENDAIKSYRNSVVNVQCRRFINLEVTAMQAYFELLDESAKKAQEQADIEAACKKVYAI